VRLLSPADIKWIVPAMDVGSLTDRIADQVRTGLGF
jgi:hypothetical protein